jgi:hypothetical protein
MPSPLRLLVVAIAAVSLVPASLCAQSDEETLARYRLTESAYAKYLQASRNMIAAWKADPAAFKEEEEDEADNPTIADLAAQYDAHPAAKRAITSAGLTSREFVTFTFAMFQAAMAAGVIKEMNGKLENVPAGTQRDNVLFYQRHEAELQRLTAEMQALFGETQVEPPA